MAKFMLITKGFKQPSPEMMQDWMKWFESIKDVMISQMGFKSGVEVKPNSQEDLEFGLEALTGGLIIDVESKEKAIEIAKQCPMITSTLVYEVMEH